MNAPLPIRLKLITAAVALVLVGGFSLFNDGITTRNSSGEIAFRAGCFILMTFLTFSGVFGNAHLQLLWGWVLAIATPLVLCVSIFILRGLSMVLGLFMVVIAVVGSYLLLADAGVRDYRVRMKRKNAA
jgi:hypothetical protein